MSVELDLVALWPPAPTDNTAGENQKFKCQIMEFKCLAVLIDKGRIARTHRQPVSILWCHRKGKNCVADEFGVVISPQGAGENWT